MDQIHEIPKPAHETMVRGNLILKGEDATLYGRIAIALTTKYNRPITTSAILREALQSFARELKISA